MMSKLITTALLVIVLLVSPAGAGAEQESERAPSRYMGGPAELVTAPNGAITNAEALKKLP